MRPSELIPADAPQRLTPSALAAYLGVHPLTVRRWVRAGLLPEPVRLNKRVHWFLTAEVRKALDRCRLKPAAVPEGGRCA